jgi:hypothetical protein
MCGIFGIAVAPGPNRQGTAEIESLIRMLFVLSETRGTEASGIAAALDGDIRLLKAPVTASKFVAGDEYRHFIAGVLRDWPLADATTGAAVIGHSRLVTNGLQTLPANNQPVTAGDVAVVHNGIVVWTSASATARAWPKPLPSCSRTSKARPRSQPSFLAIALCYWEPTRAPSTRSAAPTVAYLFFARNNTWAASSQRASDR